MWIEINKRRQKKGMVLFMKKLTRIYAGALLTVMTASMAACGGGSSSAAAPAASETAAASGAASSGGAAGASVTFAETWGGDTSGQVNYYLDGFNQFQSDNPNLKITLNSYNSSDYSTTVFKTMAAAKSLPDLFEINSIDYVSVANGNLSIDMTDTLNADPTWRDGFLPGLMAETTVGSKIVGIPYQFITNECIFYNKDLVSQAGYSAFPADWDTFLQMCATLKSNGLIPTALGDKDGWPLCSNLMEVMCDYICGPQWVSDIGAFNGNANYNDPKFISVLTLMNDFIKAGYMNSDMVSIDNNTQDKAYLYNKKAACLFGGSYTLAGVATNSPADFVSSISVAPIPRPSNAVADYQAGLFSGGSGWCYAINPSVTDPNKLQACVDIIKYLTGVDFSRMVIENNQIPCIKPSLVPNVDTTKVLPLQLEMNAQIAAAPHITLMNQEQSGSVANVIYKELQAMAVGSETPEQAAQNIQTGYAAAVTALQAAN